jgi:hypothetical protein
MRLRICFVFFIVCAIFPLAGCNFSEGGNSGESPKAITIICEVFYRADPGEALSPAPVIKFPGGSDQKYLVFDDLTFNARVQDDEFEGRALYIAITGVDETKEISRQLYQFNAENPPENQFIGGHGFTGLQYLFSPFSSGEIQYFCHIE